MEKISNQKSYLERITFDQKLNASWVARYVTNIRIVLLLTIAIAILGIFSYINLPQRLNPEIKIPIVTVITALPGAGPDDVEKLITIPLEDKLRGVSGLNTISSVSQDNVSIVTMQFVNSVAGEKAKTDSKDAVEQVTNLPEDAQPPQVQLVDFENQPVWQFAVTTTQDPVSLAAFSKKLREAIADLPEVDHVGVHGLEEQIIAVDVSPEKLAQFGISPIPLSQAIKSAVSSYPAGSVQTAQNSFSLTIDPLITSVDDLRKLLVTVGNTTVALGQIATVSERSNTNQAMSYLAAADISPRQAVTFSVFRRTSADIIKTSESVKKVVNEQLTATSNRFVVTSILNTGDLIHTQFTDLLGEFRSTILLVFACLFIFLGLRQATISAITVPLTFLSAFFFMRIYGMTINFLSLFAFLLSLGLLVDDTIVVVSAMTTYFKAKKFTPTQTGLLVWRDTIIPIWSTTITTIWSFVPLLLSSGIIGEFIKPIPVVVTITMISSTAIAVLITLPTMIVLLKPQIANRVVLLGKIVLLIALIGIFVFLLKNNPLFVPITIIYLIFLGIVWRTRSHLHKVLIQIRLKYSYVGFFQKNIKFYANRGVIDIEGFAMAYERFITRVLNSRSARRTVLIVIISYAVFSFLLLPLGLVKNEFFPKSDGDVVYINLELPSGTTLEDNKRESQNLLEQYRTIKGAEFVVADVGTSLNLDFGSRSDQTNVSLFTFHLPQKNKRTIGSMEIAEELRQSAKTYTRGKLSIIEESGGPPAGAELQLKLSGDDLSTLNTYADQIVQYLSKEAGVINIEKSIKPATSALVFVPNENKLIQNGLNIGSLGFWLRTAISGFTLDEVNFNGNVEDKRNILFTLTTDHQSPESLGRLMIPTGNGIVPLSELGSFETKANPTLITREEGKRTISVSAGISRGYSIPEKSQKLLAYANSIELPSGYNWKTGGVNEENEKSVQSILQAMVVAFLLILVTMVIQFKSFRQALIVLLVIPLAVSSVFLVFAITGTPLSFPALIGVLSLFGIVVTNSMFIVDKININRNEGMPFVKAIADAGSSRMEPIILTKLCTVLGLLPVTLADPLWRGLGGAIISGILLASSIMLLFIPVVYYSWMKPAEIKN